MNGWRDVTLGDVCELKRGYDLPNGSRRDGRIPVVSSSGPTGWHDEAKASAPGVVTGRYGTLGQVFYLAEDFWPLNTSLYVRDFKGNDPRFVAVLLRSLDLARYDGAAAVPGLNRNHLHTLPVRVPDLPTQSVIAQVNRVFDDLIENNRRRVEVLEEMARAIYREWFVKFRYPGHEGVPLVDSAFGPIPEGWTPSTCGMELNFIGGGTPAKGEFSYWEGGTVPWYTPTDLTKTGWRYAAGSALSITDLGVAKSSARRFPAGSVLMTSRATLGVLAIATSEATTNQGFIVILPDERWSPGFIYEWLDARSSELAALGTGATFKEITKGSFKSFPFVVPSQAVLDAYRVTTDPIEQQVHTLEQQTRNLSILRDLLLPKLVTGQIDVSSLDLDGLIAEQVA